MAVLQHILSQVVISFSQVTLEPLLPSELRVKTWAQLVTSSLRCALIQMYFLQVCRLTTQVCYSRALIRTHHDTLLVQILGVAFPPGESTSTKLQERLLREAAAFIITHQIPAFVSPTRVNVLQMVSFENKPVH